MHKKYPRYEFKISFPKRTVWNIECSKMFLCGGQCFLFVLWCPNSATAENHTIIFRIAESNKETTIFSTKQDQKSVESESCWCIFFRFCNRARGCSRVKFLAGGTWTALLRDLWNTIPWLDWSWTWETWVQSQIVPWICVVILCNFLSVLMTVVSLQSHFIAGVTCPCWYLYPTCTVSHLDMEVSVF